MMSSSFSSMSLLFLVVLSCLTWALGATRYIDCDSPSCYPNCCGMGVEKDVEQFLRQSRSSANMLNYLMRNREARSLDMIDAPSFGGSRTFGGFGYNQRMPATTMDYVRVVFITGNVESLTQEPGRISEWCTAVGKEIAEQRPVFASIHLQGLKVKGQKGADILDQLVKDLDGQPGLEIFKHGRQFSDVENLGLANIYYVKDEARAALFDNQRKEYWSVEGHKNEGSQSTAVRKERLAQAYNVGTTDQPASYMMTRWLLFDKPFNFVNLALSQDQSALEGCQSWPSDGTLNRRKELNSLIDGLQSQNLWDDDATFISGSFNCSVNKEKFLKDQAHTNHASCTDGVDGMGKLAKIEAIDMSGRKIFNVNANKFDMNELHDWLFNTCNGQLVRKYDQELQNFKGALFEPNIYFLPTYPYGFDRKKDTDFFLRSDCPAWKNRVVTNQKAWNMMHHDSFSSSGLYYGLIGQNLNIGETKPVSLIATICLK